MHRHIAHQLGVVVRLDVLQDGQHVHLVHASLPLYASLHGDGRTLVFLRVLEERVDLGLDVRGNRTHAVETLSLPGTQPPRHYHDVHDVVQRGGLHLRQHGEDGGVRERRVGGDLYVHLGPLWVRGRTSEHLLQERAERLCGGYGVRGVRENRGGEAGAVQVEIVVRVLQVSRRREGCLVGKIVPNQSVLLKEMEHARPIQLQFRHIVIVLRVVFPAQPIGFHTHAAARYHHAESQILLLTKMKQNDRFPV